MDRDHAEELLAVCLDRMDDDALVDLHNNWCDQNRYNDDMIFPMYELPDYIGDLHQYTLGDLFGRFQFDEFNFDHDYFHDTIYGIESTDCPEYWIDKSDLIKYILKYEDCLGNKEVEEILLELDDEDEEEEAEE